MCGIFGHITHLNELTERDIIDCRTALSLLLHRGPDAGGEWYDTYTYMGHRRLIIIDQSIAASQPFHDGTGRFILSYNGEIYNYLELKRELERDGVIFRTKSDTEVFLASWIRWGQKALNKFDGMFAAALHDRKTKCHYLFRDPLGQKPLYYHVSKNEVIYSSELRSLLTLKKFSWQINKEAFARYLMNSYYAHDETPVSNIKKLLPGCILKIEGGQARQIRYWDSVPGATITNTDENDALEEFNQLFEASCSNSMRSDVPYGVFLSGGIDSSLVLQACHKIEPGIRSFSVSMSEKDFDESSKAGLVLDNLKMKEQNYFCMNHDSILEAVDDVFFNSDEPLGDPGFVNTLFLARACKPHLTVALAGDGSDELFGGYAPFKGLAPIPWLRPIPSSIFLLVKRLATLLPQSDSYLSTTFKLRSYLQGFPSTDSLRYSLWLASCELAQLNKLCPSLSNGFFSASGRTGTILAPIAKSMEPVLGHNPQQMLHYYYQKSFLPEFVCAHTDRAAMQTSMEVRSPFLSKPLIEFANQLPNTIKVRGQTLKWLLKRSAKENGLPPAIYKQQKQGFTFPVARWLKGPLRDRMTDLLSKEFLPEELLDTNTVLQYCNNHLEGKENNYRVLYNLMVFQAWRRRYPSIQIS